VYDVHPFEKPRNPVFSFSYERNVSNLPKKETSPPLPSRTSKASQNTDYKNHLHFSRDADAGSVNFPSAVQSKY
jgi:hypothetical protein